MIKNMRHGTGLLSHIHTELSHRSYIFPDLVSDIDLTCRLVAGVSKAFGDWAELEDSDGNKLTTIVASHHIVISALRIRDTSVADKLYVIQTGYGTTSKDVTPADTHEFGSGIKHIDSDEQLRVRPPRILKGQKVYYRMKCETDSATANIELRYHYY